MELDLKHSYTMVKARRIRRRPARKGRKVARRGRKRVARSSNSNYAKCTEIIEDFAPLTGNTGSAVVMNLGSEVGCARARALAQQFKFYKLDKVELEFVPFFNTYVADSSSSTYVAPELYFAVDRTWNAGRFVGLTEMQERGISPILLGKKIVKRSFKPSTLQCVNLEVSSSNMRTVTVINEENEFGQTTQTGITGIGIQNSTPLFNKWYMTQPTTAATFGNAGSGGAYPGLPALVPPASNPLSLNYYGAVWYIKMAQPTVPAPSFGRLLVRYHWSFKTARYDLLNTPTPATNWPVDLSGSSLRPSASSEIAV